jgi:thiol-disulfide isomerase/thioredoxin
MTAAGASRTTQFCSNYRRRCVVSSRLPSSSSWERGLLAAKYHIVRTLPHRHAHLHKHTHPLNILGASLLLLLPAGTASHTMAASRWLGWCLALFLLSLLMGGGGVAAKQVLVREVRSYREFQGLIEHHKTKTGLGVIVDFYSDSCGPCRQIAPLYKQLAKQFKGKVVFAKVNVQTAHEVSSRLGIRSMPTFHFYHLGKKKQEFSGADSNRLQQFARSLATAGEKYQVQINLQDLLDFYAEHDATKTPEDVEALLTKHEPRMCVWLVCVSERVNV